MSSKWTREEDLRLISLYKEHELLWDVKSVHYHKRHLKARALQYIASIFQAEGKRVQAEDVAARFKNIRIVFQRENKKRLESIKNGASPDDIYTPRWELFDHLSFLITAVAAHEGHSHSSMDYPSVKVEVDYSDANTEESYHITPSYVDSPIYIESEVTDPPTPEFASIPKCVSSLNSSTPHKRKLDSDSENFSESVGEIPHYNRKFKDKHVPPLELSADIKAFINLMGIKLSALPRRKRSNLQAKWFKELCDAELSDSD